jgi:hypothetical protein
VSGRAGLLRAAPWLLCAVSLGLLVVSGWLRWLIGDHSTTDDVDWLQGGVSALGFAGIPVVGALIASRQPANPYGWLCCATGLLYGLSDVAHPLWQVVGGPLWVIRMLDLWGFVILVGLLPFLFLLFPTGRLPSHRWRWLARAAVVMALSLVVAVPLIPDGDPRATGPWALSGAAGRLLGQAGEVGVYVLFGVVLAAISSLVPRFRRAGPVERRQLTWFLYAAALIGLFLVVDSLDLLRVNLLYTAVSSAVFALLPASIGVAVLRYRLYEIDRIVSRTVSYGLLTGGLVVLYLTLVTALRPLLEPLTGGSSLAVAASTLAVAAVFNPVRRRLQSVVDRRFDRARYDAARAVDAFAARLRDQIELDQVVGGLRDTVAATVAPTRVGVWLRNVREV